MDFIANIFNTPKWMSGNLFFLNNDQWIALLFILGFAFLVESFFRFALNRFFINLFKKLDLVVEGSIKKFSAPLGFLVFDLIYYIGINNLEVSKKQFLVLQRVALILLSFGMVWLGHRLVDIFALYFEKKAKETETKFDDILVPLLKKTALVVVYTLGLVFILHTLTVNVTSLIAGLGIGGLAFAFAAKDTLANLFGSMMLVIDRPFDVGDIIKSGDIHGTVVEVGFRSTRLRTFHDSMVSVSNGQLANQIIDNLGRRRFRRFEQILNLVYSTPIQKIEDFCVEIRHLVENTPSTKKEEIYVNFFNIGSSSLDIRIIIFFETDDFQKEVDERHAFLINILKLASQMDIEFAYPTQTIFHQKYIKDETTSSLQS
jgi:MscS family membrane protein